MKKTISTFGFIAGLVIWISVVGFIISIPFSHILNTEDVISSALVREAFGALINIVAIVIATFMATRRYVVPGSVLKISIWVALINLIFGLLSPILLAIQLGSSNIFSFYSLSATILGSILYGGVIYACLHKFSKENRLENNIGQNI